MTEKTAKGYFVISLDFELFWGVRDKRTIDSYGESIMKVHTIIPEMLRLFRTYETKATFATVGFLLGKNKEELKHFLPSARPAYKYKHLSPYGDDFWKQDINANENGYYFASGLIDLIKKYPEHEIGTHTFSHYYCLEEGQTINEFEEDLKAAISIATANNIATRSFVFPRNQYSKAYLEICNRLGIQTFRGNENIWFRKAQSEENTSLAKRIFRTLDCYINISGHHAHDLRGLSKEKPYNIPSSRFLRPYTSKIPFSESLKLHRIKRSMTYAARHNKLYHLWWHPHNFGQDTERNMAALETILKHYRKLHKRYGFSSITMEEAGRQLDLINNN